MNEPKALYEVNDEQGTPTPALSIRVRRGIANRGTVDVTDK